MFDRNSVITYIAMPAVFLAFAMGTVRTAMYLQPDSAAAQSPEDEPETRLKQLDIQLPALSRPVGLYKRVVIVDRMAYLSGHVPQDEHGEVIRGKVGADLDVPDAQAAARRCALAMLASLRSELGDLNRVQRVVKVTGMVNCTADFAQQPTVINGCSQLFADVFGQQNGIAARSAVGMNSLPLGAVVEIEAIFELKP